MGYFAIAIIVFIIFLFLRDKQDEVGRIQRQGGFVIKYRILINHFLSIPRMQVERRSTSSITMSVKDPAVLTRFTISHGFEDVSIFWQHKSLTFGEHNLNWRFPESMSQADLIDIIEQEIGAYEKKIITNDKRESHVVKKERINIQNKEKKGKEKKEKEKLEEMIREFERLDKERLEKEKLEQRRLDRVRFEKEMREKESKEKLKLLNSLVDKILDSNKKFEIIEQDERGRVLLELYSLKYKFSFELKLNLSSGIVKVTYDVFEFSKVPQYSLLDKNIKNEFDLVDLNYINQTYEQFINNVLELSDLSNINLNPFKNFDYNRGVRLLNILEKQHKWIELVFEYGIKVRLRDKMDDIDFDDPMNPENEIQYKYEVIPQNAIQPDVIDDLRDHCILLMGGCYDKKEVNRVLEVNTDWEFKLNPEFSCG